MRLTFLHKILVFMTILVLPALAACQSGPAPSPTPTPKPSPAASSPPVAPSTPAASSPSAAPTTPAAVTIKIATKAGVGDYLADAKGMTLYYFTKDSIGKSAATAAVLANWPVFNVPNIVVQPPLSSADFGTITRDDGLKQTTFKGWPLYYYIKDQAAGDTLGQGVNNVWFVINPVTFNPQTASSPSPSATIAASTSAVVTLNLTAQGFAFDMKTITVPAGAKVLIHFNNKDSAPHNFALYQDSSATKSLFVGAVVTATATDYSFTAPTTPGTYFFRCDIHPSVMTGSFIVQ
jgi:predicted lipoprotein with Yx(FWY)xxD motif/plastocyanin